MAVVFLLQRRCCAGRGKVGFTLIELLVVMVIIALLVAILLPSLARARDQAMCTKCAANMHGVAAAVVMYCDENGGRFPIGQANGVAAYPGDGWFWSARLQTQGYLAGVNVEDRGTDRLVNNGFLLCPKGTDRKLTGTGTYPTDWPNMSYAEATDSSLSSNLEAVTWYMVTTKVGSNGAKLSTGQSSTPFMTFQTGDDAKMVDPEYQRTMQMVKNGSRLAMLIECSSNNFDNASQGAALASSSTGRFQVPRLAGRHGDVVNQGRDAETNIAFFDGHVSRYGTEPFSEKGFGAASEVNFFLQQQ